MKTILAYRFSAFGDVAMIVPVVREFLQQNKAAMIAFRRQLHKNPELSWEEVQTTKDIAAQLDETGIPYKLTEPTGLIAEIKGCKDLISGLQDLEKQVKKDIEPDSGLRGNTEAGMFD